jgi:hypothetical protein
MPAFIDLTGKKFGRLRVLGQGPGRYGKPSWICECTCGRMKDIPGSHLRQHQTVSCTCYQKLVVGLSNRRRGSRFSVGLRSLGG